MTRPRSRCRSLDGSARTLRYVAYAANSHATRRKWERGSSERRPLRECFRRSIRPEVRRSASLNFTANDTPFTLQPQRQIRHCVLGLLTNVFASRCRQACGRGCDGGADTSVDLSLQSRVIGWTTRCACRFSPRRIHTAPSWCLSTTIRYGRSAHEPTATSSGPAPGRRQARREGEGLPAVECSGARRDEGAPERVGGGDGPRAMASYR